MVLNHRTVQQVPRFEMPLSGMPTLPLRLALGAGMGPSMVNGLSVCRVDQQGLVAAFGQTIRRHEVSVPYFAIANETWEGVEEQDGSNSARVAIISLTRNGAPANVENFDDAVVATCGPSPVMLVQHTPEYWRALPAFAGLGRFVLRVEVLAIHPTTDPHLLRPDFHLLDLLQGSIDVLSSVHVLQAQQSLTHCRMAVLRAAAVFDLVTGASSATVQEAMRAWHREFRLAGYGPAPFFADIIDRADKSDLN